jgi:hypothetical protein
VGRWPRTAVDARHRHLLKADFPSLPVMISAQYKDVGSATAIAVGSFGQPHVCFAPIKSMRVV